MINAVDDLLADVLRREWKESGKGFVPGEMPIVAFGPVSSVPDGAPPTLSLGLVDVRENTALRQDPFLARRAADGRTAVKRRSPLRFDLTYAVAGRAGDPRAEHALLTFALGAFLRNPLVDLPKVAGQETAESVAIAIAQPEDVRATASPERQLVVFLRATAPFDPFDRGVVPLVRQAVFGFGKGTEPGFLGQPVDVRAIRLSAAGLVTTAGKPLPDVLVSVPERLARTTTDVEGRYLLLNLPPGPHEIVFEKRGFVTVHHVYDVPPPGRVNELREFDLAMEPLGHDGILDAARDLPPLDFSYLIQTDLVQRTSVVGRLRYPDGSVAAYVPVRRGNLSTVTDSQGVYALGLAPSSAPLLAEIPGRGLVEVVNETAPEPGEQESKPEIGAMASTAKKR